MWQYVPHGHNISLNNSAFFRLDFDTGPLYKSYAAKQPNAAGLALGDAIFKWHKFCNKFANDQNPEINWQAIS